MAAARSQLTTDVLVVGGGLAALRTALDARRAGADVTIAVKGKLGRSGSSAMTSAGYSSAVTHADSPASHLADTMKGGRQINNEELVEILANEALTRLDELVALGGSLAEDGGGRLIHPSGDHSTPRTVVAASFKGLDFTLPLAEAVREAGCHILEQTMVADVLIDRGTVVGAVCLAFGAAEEIVEIQAPSVVLAAGGCGQLFAVTSNPNDVTGDGYAIALRAGAQLRDMEFIQFYPWRCIVPFENTRMPIQPSTFVAGARLYNSDHERFMLRYDADRLEATTRDIAARGIYDQIRTGKSIKGGVVLDLSEISDDDWRRTNPKPSQYFDRRGISFRTVEMILAPEAHFFMGGVVSDADGRSTVEGLFVAGENAGGVHGANRLDSNAIPETQVFGARAGRAAADFAAGADRAPAAASMEEWLDGHPDLVSPGEDTRNIHQELLRSVQKTAWENLGIVRDARRLLAGLAELNDDVSALAGLPVPGNQGDRVARLELKNLLAVGRACFTAALTRTESRGAHYRLDFPEQDDANWRGSLILTQERDAELTIRRVTATDGRAMEVTVDV